MSDSEITRRAEELRDVARACATLNDFARHLGWSMEVARHANATLGLDLPDARLRAGPVKAAQAHPKPVKRK